MPKFVDDDRRHAGAVLHVATLFIGCASLIAILVNVVTGIATVRGSTIGAVAVAVCIVMNVLNRRGHVRGASLGFVALFYLLACAIGVHYAGIHPSTFGLLILVALVSGSLFSGRAAIVMCGFGLVANGAIIALAAHGVLTPKGVLTATSKGISTSMVLIATTAILVHALRRLRAAAEDAEARGAALARANDELRAIRMSLEQQVDERTKSLVAARDAAEAATRAKSTFLANMSHELRTPLHAVIGLSSLLLEKKADSEERRLIEALLRGGDALLAIINDVLDLSKIEAGRMVVETAPYDPRVVVDEVAALLGPQADAKGLRLGVHFDDDVPAFVLGDKARVRQVLLNLVGNAIKFTAKGSVHVDVKREGTDHLRFAVVDTGIGVAPEMRDRLFSPFVQGDASTTKKYGGTGLGLAISKHFAELMAGAIGVDGAPEGGSIFWFTASAPKAADDARPPSSPPRRVRAEGSERSLSILLAEDNVVSQMVAVNLLKHLGHRADVVNSGVAALNALQQRAYDVVLMDVGMPEMDGLEATRRIRAAADVKARPWIIAVTANALQDERQACYEAGVDDFVTKPVMIDVLAQALARVPATTTG